MRDELMPFQKIAVSKLLAEINSAEAYYKVDGRPQVIAFRAPTGSGKTIVMTDVIEKIIKYAFSFHISTRTMLRQS